MSKKPILVPIIGVLVSIAVITGFVALGSATLPQQVAEGGEVKLVSPTLFEVIEVDAVDHLTEHVDSVHPEAEIAGPESEPTLSLQSIREVKDRVGAAYAPTSVPDGFSLIGRGVIGDHSVQTSYSSGPLQLLISQESLHGQPRVKRGHVEQVTVNGQPAYFVRGTWHKVVKRDGSVSTTEWDPALGISLYFQKDSHWFSVTALPDPETQSFNKETLLSVAESIELQP